MKTKTKKLQDVFTAEEVGNIIAAARHTWGVIAYDVEQIFESEGINSRDERIAGMVEMVLDANRIQTSGQPMNQPQLVDNELYKKIIKNSGMITKLLKRELLY
jgi:hypothetical protein